MCSFNRGNIEGTNFFQIFVFDVCVCTFFVCVGIGIVDQLEKGGIPIIRERF